MSEYERRLTNTATEIAEAMGDTWAMLEYEQRERYRNAAARVIELVDEAALYALAERGALDPEELPA